MFINIQKLFKLPVFTLSETKLGHVADVELNVEGHNIRHYIVEHGIIGKDHYWVAPRQVLSITAEKIVVEDTILTDPDLKESKNGYSKKRLKNAALGV